MNKPSLPLDTNTHEWRMKMRELLEIVLGRRANRIDPPAEMRAQVAAGAAPTKAEFDALLVDVQNLRATVVAYQDRLDDA